MYMWHIKSLVSMQSLLLNLSLFVLGLIGSEGCISGWEQNGNACYFFSRDSTHWAEAESLCKAFGAKLAEPHNQDMIDYLAGAIQREPSNYYLIGGSDFFVEGEWIWTSNKQRITTTNWEPGEPNDYAHHEDCLTIRPDGKWNDVPCTSNYPFICETENENAEDLIG